MLSSSTAPTHNSPGELNPGGRSSRNRSVGDTLRCPHCDERLAKWRVPESPFNEWPSEFQYICFNDKCSYFVSGWNTMAAQVNLGSYRFMFDPLIGGCYPVAVLDHETLKDGIVSAD